MKTHSKCLLFLACLLTSTNSHAVAEDCQTCETHIPKSQSFSYAPYLEFLAGYFRPDNSILRSIYHSGGPSLQGEAGLFINKYFALAFNAQCFFRNGTALNSDSTTQITIWSLAVLGKVFWPVNKYFKPYVGTGPRLAFFKTRDSSPYVQHIVTKNKLGASFVAGGQIYFNGGHFFLDPFIEYYWAPKLHFGRNKSSLRYDTQINGITAGLGAGYKF